MARMIANLIHHKRTDDTKCSLRPLRPSVKSGSEFGLNEALETQLFKHRDFGMASMGETIFRYTSTKCVDKQT